MEGDNSNSNTVPQMGTAAEPRVLPVSEGVEVAGGLEDKLNYVGGDDGHGGVAVGASGGAGELSGKRKRGRPRKQPAVELQGEFMVVPESSASPQKRGRGRPKGSGKWQTLAASLGTFCSCMGRNHNMLVNIDLYSLLYNYALEFDPSKLCLLKVKRRRSQLEATSLLTQLQFNQERILFKQSVHFLKGLLNQFAFFQLPIKGFPITPISLVILLRQGRFEIVSLTGSHSNNAAGGGHGKICLLSVQLANPDGGLFGGAVAGSLIAGGPTQLVIATFRQKFREQPKVQHHIEPNQAAVAVSLQTANGTFPDSEMNGLSLSTAPPVPAPPVNGMDKGMNGPDVNHASPQPFDWNSLQSSAHMSQHVLPSDVNTGAAD
ncbi:AT-hook motif nuclear-localized protein 6 [Sesamum angolense]|uniref:AT-hook motif nuclear-localized protein n=1 Tax=Sesamum angolense TaxID=2727404 RepID=A0AAE1WNG3_9LAMI|nr:AT-hook motif nuclear-localized protein 6 [Sesamum angolense]